VVESWFHHGEKPHGFHHGNGRRLIEMIRDKISDESAGNALRMMQEIAMATIGG
jgi:hypothetical protein